MGPIWAAIKSTRALHALLWEYLHACCKKVRDFEDAKKKKRKKKKKDTEEVKSRKKLNERRGALNSREFFQMLHKYSAEAIQMCSLCLFPPSAHSSKDFAFFAWPLSLFLFFSSPSTPSSSKQHTSLFPDSPF